MDLYEYQAKELFAAHGVPVLPGEVADTAAEARAAAAVSLQTSGSMTITPVSPSTTVMFDRSRPRTW